MALRRSHDRGKEPRIDEGRHAELKNQSDGVLASSSKVIEAACSKLDDSCSEVQSRLAALSVHASDVSTQVNNNIHGLIRKLEAIEIAQDHEAALDNSDRDAMPRDE